MITSKRIINISEEWIKSVTTYGDKKCEVYENPGSNDVKELYQLGKLVRYIANAKSQTVFVWSAEFAIHNTIRQSLNLGKSGPDSYKTSPFVIEDFGQISGNRIISVIRDYEGTFWKLEGGMKNLLDWEKTSLLSSEIVNLKLHLNERIISKLTAISNYNWSFVDKYIVGDGARLKKLQVEFSQFMKRLETYK